MINKVRLRPYQIECINIIISKPPGNYLVAMATGLGKTIIFTQLPNYIKGRMLILSHRIELVFQPLKYINCSKIAELGKSESNGEKVVSSTIQTFIKRYKKFDPNYFDTIIIDECHHSSAKTYIEIIKYFQYKKLIGFSATPNRHDNIRLDNIFQEIIFERPLKWGIVNNYLSGIECKAVNIGYSLKNVKNSNGDYQEKSLDISVNIDKANKAIAEAYYKYSKGPTMIFCVSVNHCYRLQKYIPEAKVIEGQTKNRDKIIKNFTDGEFRCLINCQVFIEGTDIPKIGTIIIARPTKNNSLYIQMVGRGLRLYPGKKKLLLIDCVGSYNQDLCLAPCLFGLNIHDTKIKPNEIQGDIFDLSNFIEDQINDPETYIKNIRNIKLFKKKFGYDLHNVNYLLNPDGSFVLKFPGFNKKIPHPDKLGYIKAKKGKIKIQKAFDIMYNHLIKNYEDKIQLWDLNKIKQWGKYDASDKQKQLVRKFYPAFNTDNLNKMEAMILINKGKEN